MSEQTQQPATVQDGALTPTQLLSQAIGAGVSIEQLEKLMELQERWEARQAKRAFDEAMAAFQAEKPEITKDKVVSFGAGKAAYKYAPLPTIQKAIDPVLARHGLSYSWQQEAVDNKYRITCVVSHVAGHSQSNHLEAPADNSGGKNPIQQIGSTVMYLKRYTLSNAFGIAADDDDDGHLSKISPEEIAEFRLTKLMDLRMEHESDLTDQWLKRIDEIIANKEAESYEKAINTIKKQIK